PEPGPIPTGTIPAGANLQDATGLPAPLPETTAGRPPAMIVPPPIGGIPVIDIRGASRVYQMGELEVPALVEANLRVEVGEFVAIIGPSGSGKSTLMNLIGCLDRPTSGEVHLAGTSVAELDDDGLAAVRSRFVGFVFQSYNLLPRTTALENVMTPLLYQGVSRRERVERATVALERLGLGDRLNHQPTELSGGQQQRVAIARALVTNPPLILADEPTGNLDSHAGADVLAVFRELHAAGRTVVLITHDPDVAAAAPRQIHIRDGRLVA
ncbi:MAG: ABC transporter ATP-binding protein, partial [Candidatus Limnocylindrales bacterium]